MAFRRGEKRTQRSKIDATPPWDTRQRDEPAATQGPYDVRDEPTDDIARIDLGALRVPVWAGVDLRLDVNEQQQLMSVTLANADGHMQLGVFAAPRNEGIWDQVRTEIAESLRSQRGTPTESESASWGTQLTGTLAADAGRLPVRFIGVDGPRWFLRAMLVGPAAQDEAKGEPFEKALREVVVVRGSDPLPVRDPVPLRMPKEIGDSAAPPADGAAP